MHFQSTVHIPYGGGGCALGTHKFGWPRIFFEKNQRERCPFMQSNPREYEESRRDVTRAAVSVQLFYKTFEARRPHFGDYWDPYERYDPWIDWKKEVICSPYEAIVN